MKASPITPGNRWQITPGTLWTVEHDGVMIGDNLRNEWVRLAYPEAAVWDLLARGRTEDDTAALLQWIAALSPAEARKLVKHCKERWQAEARLRAWQTSR